MQNNPLKTIQDFDQNIWQDDLQRKMLVSGELQQLIDEDGIREKSSNPLIFPKGIVGGSGDDTDVQFRPVPHKTFPALAEMGWQSNRLLPAIQPEEGVSLYIEMKL